MGNSRPQPRGNVQYREHHDGEVACDKSGRVPLAVEEDRPAAELYFFEFHKLRTYAREEG